MSQRDAYFEEVTKRKKFDDQNVTLRQRVIELKEKLKKMEKELNSDYIEISPAQRRQWTNKQEKRKKVGASKNKTPNPIPTNEEEAQKIEQLKKRTKEQMENIEKQNPQCSSSKDIKDALDGCSKDIPFCKTINSYFESGLHKNKKAAYLANALFANGKRQNVEEGLALLEIAHKEGSKEATTILAQLYSNMYPTLHIQPQPLKALELLQCIKQHANAFKKTNLAYDSPQYNNISRKVYFYLAIQLIQIQESKKGITILEDLVKNQGYLEAYYVLAIKHLEGSSKSTTPNMEKAEQYLEKIVAYLSFSEELLEDIKKEAIEEHKLEKKFQKENKDYPERLAYHHFEKDPVTYYKAIFEHCETPFLDYLRKHALEYDRFMGPPVHLDKKPNIKRSYNSYKRPYILGPKYNWRMEKTFLIDIYCGSLITLAEICLTHNKIERADTLLALLPFGFKPNTYRYDFEIAMLYLENFPQQATYQKKGVAILENIAQNAKETFLLERTYHALGVYYMSKIEQNKECKKDALNYFNSAAQMGYYPSMLQLMTSYTHGSKLLLKNHTLATFWYRSIAAICNQQNAERDAILKHATNWSSFADTYTIPELNRVKCPSNLKINIWRSPTIELFLWLSTQSNAKIDVERANARALIHRDTIMNRLFKTISFSTTLLLFALPLRGNHYQSIVNHFKTIGSILFNKAKGLIQK